MPGCKPRGDSEIDGHSKSILYEHWEIHSGNAYFAGVAGSHGNAVKYCIKTPKADNKLMHLFLDIMTDGSGWFDIYENPDSVSGGSDVTIFNTNRASSKTSGVQSFKSGVTASGGTQFPRIRLSGSKKNESIMYGRVREIILKYDTEYVFVWDATGSGIAGAITWSWYEHTFSEKLDVKAGITY